MLYFYGSPDYKNINLSCVSAKKSSFFYAFPLRGKKVLAMSTYNLSLPQTYGIT